MYDLLLLLFLIRRLVYNKFILQQTYSHRFPVVCYVVELFVHSIVRYSVDVPDSRAFLTISFHLSVIKSCNSLPDLSVCVCVCVLYHLPSQRVSQLTFVCLLLSLKRHPHLFFTFEHSASILLFSCFLSRFTF